VLAAAAATRAFHAVSRRLLDPGLARIATLLFAAHQAVAFAAAGARPYALGLFFVVTSSHALLAWLEAGGRRRALAYAGLAALMIHAHYLLAPMLLVHALALARATPWHEPSRRGEMALAGLVLAGLTLPAAIHLGILAARLEQHTAFLLPPPLAVGSALTPPAACLLLLAATARRRPGTVPWSTAVLATAWALVPPVALLAATWLLGALLWFPRYHIAAVPGVCLLIALALGHCVRHEPARTVAAAIFAFALLVGHAGATHFQENWRAAVPAVNDVAGGRSLPLLVRCGFLEALHSPWLEDPARNGLLLAP
jgi:hypothetical protein